MSKHKSRVKHLRKIAFRYLSKRPERERVESVKHNLVVPDREVTIAKDADVPSRYQGTKAKIIGLDEVDAACVNLADFPVLVKAYRRKSPLRVRLGDLLNQDGQKIVLEGISRAA